MKRFKKLFTRMMGIVLIAGAVVGYMHYRSLAGHNSSRDSTVNHLPVNIAAKSVTYNLSSIPNITYYRNRVVIVTFHDISPDVYSPFVISPSQFSADLDALQSRFHVITNQQFIQFLNHHAQVPPNAVLLTFDDGYRGMYTYALPELLKHHMQGTFFEIVGTADENDPTKLTWDQIKTMTNNGMIFASHTYNSHYEVLGLKGKEVPVFDTRMPMNGSRETIQHFNERVYTDFLKARLELQAEIGEPVFQFAWPFGWGIPESTYMAKRVGYEYIYTTTEGCVTQSTSISAIPRIDIGKPWINPVKALQMVIHFSHVVPSPVGSPFGNHHSTEVNVVVHHSAAHSGQTSSSNGSGTKGKNNLAGTKQQGTHSSTGSQGSHVTTTNQSGASSTNVTNTNGTNTTVSRSSITNTTN